MTDLDLPKHFSSSCQAVTASTARGVADFPNPRYLTISIHKPDTFLSAMEGQQRNHRRGARPSVGYLLFQYQSELTRRHAEPTRLSRTKINIIDGLVSRTIRHLKHCSVEELQACKRGLVYKEQLRDQLKGMRRRRSSAAPNTSQNSSSKTSKTVAAKAPSTPPKPKTSEGGRPKVSIFGPEIFV
ncbi:uncharacterized protein [Drosophila kikkawai]|uniref:Uncharacterized protein isoform X2 n=1 Tax=Drosophila kikkawai TaxID=30033 RepID=A0A6P4J1N8_DROKI|nr:uncharacterized protein LOC108078829 isoform X1 [Drosophila kikkawai]